MDNSVFQTTEPYDIENSSSVFLNFNAFLSIAHNVCGLTTGTLLSRVQQLHFNVLSRGTEGKVHTRSVVPGQKKGGKPLQCCNTFIGYHHNTAIDK